VCGVVAQLPLIHKTLDQRPGKPVLIACS